MNPQYNHRQDQSVLTALLAKWGIAEHLADSRWGWEGQKDCDKQKRSEAI